MDSPSLIAISRVKCEFVCHTCGVRQLGKNYMYSLDRYLCLQNLMSSSF